MRPGLLQRNGALGSPSRSIKRHAARIRSSNVLPITLAPTQRLLNPLKTHSSNTRNFAVQILPRHQQKLEHKHST